MKKSVGVKPIVSVEDAEKTMILIKQSQIAITVEDEAFHLAKKKLEEEIADLTQAYYEKIKPETEKINSYVDLLFGFAQKNRENLTKPGSKTIRLPSGSEMSWKFTPPKVIIASPEKVILYFKNKKGLKKFLRIKYEVDKKAILKQPLKLKNVPGISIEQHEQFEVRPSEVKAVVAEVDALKRHLASQKV
jgi:phage host-nuclease inhibitor protein Gam